MNAGGSTVVGARPRTVVDDPRAPGLGLREAFRIFTRQRSARAIAGMLLVVLAARVAVGGFTGWDMALMGFLVLLQPFSEWVIHVFVLHWRPRRIGRFTLDTQLAREHRAHHQAPHDPRYWYIPLRGGLLGFWASMGLVALVMPTLGLWLSFVVGTTALALVYEWTHYLCHSSYRPKGRLYKNLWRHHRLHHFKNEHYWMGVTNHLGDQVLGTMPEPKEVEISPTCRNLLAQGQHAAS